MIKISIVTLFSITLTSVTVAQLPVWEWAKSGLGTSHDFSYDLVTDNFGHCIVTGVSQSDSLTFDGLTLMNPGPFVVKYDTDGNLIWARKFPMCETSGITVDVLNDIYITGYFNTPTIQFDNVTLTNVGAYDMFLVKMNPAGNVIWAKSAGSTLNDFGSDVAADPGGYIYVTGIYESTIIFGIDTLNVNFSSDVYITKYDIFGNSLWAKSINGDEQDEVFAVSADPNGDVVIAGNYQSSSLHCGTDTLFNFSGGSSDMFIVKLTGAGNYLWSKSIGGNSWDECFDMDVSSTGNVYLTGRYLSYYLNIDSANTTNMYPGYADIFISKFNGNGDFEWVKTTGGMEYDQARSVAVDDADNCYVTGMYRSVSMDFDNSTLINPNPNGSEIFIAKIDSAGNDLWQMNLGNSNDNWSRRIKMTNDSSLYITGSFTGNNLTVGSFMLQGNGSLDHTLFTAKLSQLSTSLNETEVENHLNIYPNPNDGSFEIQNLTSGKMKVTVYSSMGKLIRESENEEKKFHLDLSSQPAAMYFVKAEFENKPAVIKKVIIY